MSPTYSETSSMTAKLSAMFHSQQITFQEPQISSTVITMETATWLALCDPRSRTKFLRQQQCPAILALSATNGLCKFKELSNSCKTAHPRCSKQDAVHSTMRLDQSRTNVGARSAVVDFVTDMQSNASINGKSIGVKNVSLGNSPSLQDIHVPKQQSVCGNTAGNTPILAQSHAFLPLFWR